MKRMRITAAVLAAVLAIVSVPAGAVLAGERNGMLLISPAPSPIGYFSDIYDAKTEAAVEQLRMMGVINGMGHGNFAPQGNLTRAEFCKMAIVLVGGEKLAPQYKNYTIFPDVRQSHWAVSYINMAVRGEGKFITGFPNGTFGPDAAITFGQAVTILMRMLGYTDADAGAVWPDGYLTKASEAGVTDGIELGGYDKITRAAAAKLFANLLVSNTKSGTQYIGTLAQATQRVVMLSVSETAADGTENALFTSAGVFKTITPACNTIEGKKGLLVLDANEKVLTFIPDEETVSRTVTVAGTAAGYITDVSGAKYTVSADTVTYFRGQQAAWSTVFSSVRTGSSLVVYYGSSGAADYVFAGAAQSENAAVITADGSMTEVNTLTGGKSVAVYKNGTAADASMLKKYDVAVYNAQSGRVDVSDIKLTGVFEDASPNVASPDKVWMMGAEFTVLPCAQADFAAFAIGDRLTLLLTADGEVAGAVSQYKVSANAFGVVKTIASGSAVVELACGLTVSGDVHLRSASAEEFYGQLVRVTSTAAGRLDLTKVYMGAAFYGDYNTRLGTIGDLRVNANAVIYEKVGGGALRRINISDLPETVDAAAMQYISADENDRVSLLVLEDVTGDCYTYGKAVYTEGYTASFYEFANPTIAVVNSNGQSSTVVATGIFETGEWIGLAVSADGSAEAGAVRLSKLASVPFSSWDGDTVTIRGESYKVASDVQCYNKTTDKWMKLDAAKAFAASADIYCYGAKVRVIVVK